MKLKNGAYFITGIDTDAGKTYCTAHLALELQRAGVSVITQKMVQTGCEPSEISEDIATHRRLISGGELMPEDRQGLTCTQIFRFPSSPHLAASLDGSEVDLDRIAAATAELCARYEVVLVEGAGGIMVSLREDYTTADYIVERGLPVILVSSARLGSQNHTFLTLEYCRTRGIEVCGILYNLYPQTSPVIAEDTREQIRRYLARYYPTAFFHDVPIF